jgi:hypothetical protein
MDNGSLSDFFVVELCNGLNGFSSDAEFDGMYKWYAGIRGRSKSALSFRLFKFDGEVQ